MKPVVIDASVAAKWFLPSANETLVEEAVALLKRYARGKVQFVVPDLFWAELGNVFWKAVRGRRWSQSDAETAVVSVLERKFPTVPATNLLRDAFDIAATFDRTVYDSL